MSSEQNAETDRFCSSCGTSFAGEVNYPKRCASCGAVAWGNPLPVAVCLVPLVHRKRRGLLVIRRHLTPGHGKLALPGGFVDHNEAWQDAAAREVWEEAGLRLSPAELTPLHFASTTPRANRLILFCLAKERSSDTIPPFATTTETSERGIIYGPAGLELDFAFSLQLEVVQGHFEGRGCSGPYDFHPL